MEFFQRIEDNHIYVITVEGRITAGEDTAALRDCFEQALQVEAIDTFIVNLKKVPFIDSNGLGVISSFLEKTRIKNKKLILCELVQIIEDLLLVSGLNSLLTLYPTEKEALSALIE
ncbi:MAG: STAS domain-containing protein [SAR324 cluster bacterium]|nr:STAS domain-containing protein [SAR324 cluster bacterium]